MASTETRPVGFVVTSTESRPMMSWSVMVRLLLQLQKKSLHNKAFIKKALKERFSFVKKEQRTCSRAPHHKVINNHVQILNEPEFATSLASAFSTSSAHLPFPGLLIKQPHWRHCKREHTFIIQLHTTNTIGVTLNWQGALQVNEAQCAPLCVAGERLSPSDYGNLWKMDGPTETCEEQTLQAEENCGDEVSNHSQSQTAQWEWLLTHPS